jgi:hypothetical protein
VWPGSPVTIQIGRQDASWGTGLFVKSDNRDRFKVTAKFGDTIALYTYDKYIEVGGLHDTASLDDGRALRRRDQQTGRLERRADRRDHQEWTNPAVTRPLVRRYAIGRSDRRRQVEAFYLPARKTRP